MERNISEYSNNHNDNNNMFYNDNYVSNYEELACCNNAFITAILQGNGTNILNYLNDLCFKNDSADYEAQMEFDPRHSLKTPLCSHAKNKSKNSNNFITDNGFNDDFINNYINNGNNSSNNKNKENSNKSENSEMNPSNDSAPEPIMSEKKYDNLINQNKNMDNGNNVVHRNKTNIFNAVANVFKDFFFNGEKENEEKDDDNKSNNSELKNNLKHRPILKRIIEKDIISPLNKYSAKNILHLNHNSGSNNNNTNQSHNGLRHANSHVFRRPELFADNILSLHIEEQNNEDISKLVSFIPVFTVKENNKSKEGNNNKCAICISDFEVGEKKSTLPCMHCFHYNCIEKWIKRQKCCPICKFDISFESLKSSIDQNYI